jgi:hypothetical protein
VTTQLPRIDTKPWYRQFWPWFLILLPASVVVASIYTAYIAQRGADDLVADDYYKDGLAINRRLARQQHAQSLGVSARLQFTDDAVIADVAGPVTENELRLSLAHPLEADRDFAVTVTRVGPQSYRGALPHIVAPHWHWTLEQPRESTWRLAGTVQAVDIVDASRN